MSPSPCHPNRSGLRGPWPAEVQHLHGAVRAHLDVGRLQIAMDDALLVRRFERFGDLLSRSAAPRRSGSGPCAMRSASRRPSTSSITSAFTPGRVFEPVDGRDVRVIERGEDFGFALKRAATPPRAGSSARPGASAWCPSRDTPHPCRPRRAGEDVVGAEARATGWGASTGPSPPRAPLGGAPVGSRCACPSRSGG